MTESNNPKSNSEQKTEIAIVLDKSGSMGRCKKQVVDGFNEYVDTLKADYGDSLGEVNVTVVLFSGSVQEIMFRKKVEDLEKLSDDDFVPFGSTAMYDAVGYTVDKLLGCTDNDDPNTSYLIMVMSDGEENASKTYKQTDIAEKIQTLQDTNRWTFSYLISNQDLSKATDKLGTPHSNVRSYNSSGVGTTAAMADHKHSLEKFLSCRAGGQTSTTTFYGDSK